MQNQEKTCDADLSDVINGAAKSLTKLMSSMAAHNAKPANSFASVVGVEQNDNWHFAMRMYHKLKFISDSR